jgi:hypothetical protein
MDCFASLHPAYTGSFPAICEERSDEASTPPRGTMDCFAEPVIGRRFAPARWLAMTVSQEDAASFCGCSATVITNPS